MSPDVTNSPETDEGTEMTDRQQLILLLEEYEVVWTSPHWDKNAVRIEAQIGPKQVGYAGSSATFNFRGDGSFIDIAIYE